MSKIHVSKPDKISGILNNNQSVSQSVKQSINIDKSISQSSNQYQVYYQDMSGNNLVFFTKKYLNNSLKSVFRIKNMFLVQLTIDDRLIKEKYLKITPRKKYKKL